MTWCNGHEGVSSSWAKLDKVVINNAFLAQFVGVHLSYLSWKFLDHRPMVVTFDRPTLSYGPTLFRFMNMWCSHENFLQCVKEAWHRLDSVLGLMRLFIQLKHTKVALRGWNKTIFWHVKRI